MGAWSTRRLRFACFIASVSLLICAPTFADEKPLLEAGTERVTPGEIRPPAALLRFVLGVIDKDDIRQLDECIEEKELKRADYASLLRAVKIEAGAGRTLWFVRPAHEPFCLAFYGAHLFRYFWIEEQAMARPRYRLRYQEGGDFFTVYPEQSHGLNDIEATGCIATECRSARMSFDGKKYQVARCFITLFKEGVEEKKERPCRSDDGWDNQSTGLVPPPKD